MIKLLLLLHSLHFVIPFTLLDNIAYQRPKKLCPCLGLPDSIIEIVKEQEIIELNCDYNTGEICLSYSKSFIQTVLDDFGFPMTSIYISITHLPYPNTLYNVVLHESLHALGLGHSDKPGIMNYTVKTLSNQIINDNNKLWLSSDDIAGLKFITDVLKMY